MIRYTAHPSGITAAQLQGGFFVGWPSPPTPETHLEILRSAYRVVLAIDEAEENQPVIGFINALSDGIISAYIPLLEVLPNYQRKGIGATLVKRMLDTLQPMYAIDLLCDESLIPFYRRLGLIPLNGMGYRNYVVQSGMVNYNPTSTD